MICGAIRGLRNRGDTPPCHNEGWGRRALHDRAMMQPDGSSARDHIPRANWRSFVPPQIAAILGTTRHCVLLIARGSTAIFSVFCGTDERFCFDPPRAREERCALNR